MVLILITAFPIAARLEQAVGDSVLAPVFLNGVPVMLDLLPGEFGDAVDALGEVARAVGGSSS